MDQNKLKDICQEALDISFNGINIIEFKVFPTQWYDEGSNKWVPDSFSLFIVLKKPHENHNQQDYEEFETSRKFDDGVQNFLEGLLGFECCVDFL